MKGHQHPRVSIGLPVYNGQRYLTAAIESLLAQTFTDFELIISDNASSDATEQICRSFAARDSRIRYIRQSENRGAPWNFNHVFEQSRGEYFKWQACDDLCAPTLLERCVDVLDRDRSVVLCCPQTAVIDPQGELIHDAPGSSLAADAVPNSVRKLDSTKAHDRIRGVLLHTAWCYELFAVVRASAMRQTRLHRHRTSGGTACLLELALQGRFVEVPEPLFFNRRHAGQYTMLRTAAEQFQFDHPNARPRGLRIPQQIPCMIDYAACIRRSPLAWRQKLRCYGILVRYVMQIHKWKRVLTRALGGRGLWDGSLRPPEEQKPQEPAVDSRPAAAQLDYADRAAGWPQEVG